jgi:hypothetical protein
MWEKSKEMQCNAVEQTNARRLYFVLLFLGVAIQHPKLAI